MHDTELLVLGFLVVVPTLSVVARALRVPYPIVLVLGGLPLGFIPGVPDIALDPELVLVLFLPPVLYVTAFFANLRELRADARAISLSAVPLVLFTARIRAADTALERLEELAAEGWTREDKIQKLRAQYGHQRQRFAAQAGEREDDGYEDRSLACQRLVRELLAAQRAAILRLRNEGAINNEVMRRIERELDLEESRLEI
jgi:hypothetical protein